MSAVAVLTEAQAAGVRVLAERGRVRLIAEAELSPELLTRLRAHKIELLELLAGRLCRHCGGLIEDLRPGWIPFLDGTAAHLGCYERAEVARLRARAANATTPEALADVAEITVRGEDLS